MEGSFIKSHLASILPSSTMTRIHSAKLLMVGAGGIGCELLKSLLCTGFRNIEMIDLDTIDISNLNRQFLFRRQHVGLSKAEVARSSVLDFVSPSLLIDKEGAVRLMAHHVNIKNREFGVDFFSGFDLVLNALDNVSPFLHTVDARRHVNRMCLAAHIPLVESGTQGYLGQVTLHSKPHSECFECNPTSAASKTYATCTIRNTPDQPVHCIVWAKHIVASLFGSKDDSNLMADFKLYDAEPETGHVTEDIGELDHLKAAMRVFDRLFTTEIIKQLEATERWRDRRPPLPLYLHLLMPQLSSAATLMPSEVDLEISDLDVMNVSQQANRCINCLVEILRDRRAELGHLEFDKDDVMLMDLVSSMANLRMHQYHITMLSRFAVKGIAGNIIHAVATTNAIAGGLIVMEAIKDYAESSAFNPAFQISMPPNPLCSVCSHSVQFLTLDTSLFSLDMLYKLVFVSRLAMIKPSIDVSNRNSGLGTSQDVEEDMSPDVLSRPLAHASIKIDNEAHLNVVDEAQNISFRIIVQHMVGIDTLKYPGGFVLSSQPVNAAEVQASPAQLTLTPVMVPVLGTSVSLITPADEYLIEDRLTIGHKRSLDELDSADIDSATSVSKSTVSRHTAMPENDTEAFADAKSGGLKRGKTQHGH